MSESEDSFLSHLVELRDRLIRALIAIGIVFVCLFPWAKELYSLLAQPLLATLPQRLSNVEWSPNGKLLLGNPFSSDNITVFDDAGYQQYGGCLRC